LSTCPAADVGAGFAGGSTDSNMDIQDDKNYTNPINFIYV